MALYVGERQGPGLWGARDTMCSRRCRRRRGARGTVICATALVLGEKSTKRPSASQTTGPSSPAWSLPISQTKGARRLQTTRPPAPSTDGKPTLTLRASGRYCALQVAKRCRCRYPRCIAAGSSPVPSRLGWRLFCRSGEGR